MTLSWQPSKKKRLTYELAYPEGLPPEIKLQLQHTYQQAHSAYRGKFDELLDGERHGPSWLRDPAVGEIVQNALHYTEDRLGRYRL